MPTPYSHYTLVEHGRIPIAETCSKNSWSKQVPDCSPFCCASVSFLLREPTTPEAIGFPKQFKTQKSYALNLFGCCSKLFSERGITWNLVSCAHPNAQMWFQMWKWLCCAIHQNSSTFGLQRVKSCSCRVAWWSPQVRLQQLGCVREALPKQAGQGEAKTC